MLGYDRIFQSCQFLVLILVVVNEQHEDRCEIRGTVLKCLSMPSKIPNTVQEVFVLNCDLQNNILEFGSGQWENITLLDIKADKGKKFRDRHNPIFKGLTKLKTLGIHGKALNEWGIRRNAKLRNARFIVFCIARLRMDKRYINSKFIFKKV